MNAAYYEIRLCKSCGLRYPLIEDHPFGARCPACLGETDIVRRENFSQEVAHEGNKLPKGIKLHVLLDNIRSAWNVGSILRTADGFGFEHAYLCGITPTPDQAEVRKTAVGAEEFVTWSAHRNGLEQVRTLQEDGWQILALEKTKNSFPIQAEMKRLRQTPSVLVLGNEITGIDPDILELADHVGHLPMHGQKRSLNVAVAFAAAAILIHNRLIDYPG